MKNYIKVSFILLFSICSLNLLSENVSLLIPKKDLSNPNNTPYYGQVCNSDGELCTLTFERKDLIVEAISYEIKDAEVFGTEKKFNLKISSIIEPYRNEKGFILLYKVEIYPNDITIQPVTDEEKENKGKTDYILITGETATKIFNQVNSIYKSEKTIEEIILPAAGQSVKLNKEVKICDVQFDGACKIEIDPKKIKATDITIIIYNASIIDPKEPYNGKVKLVISRNFDNDIYKNQFTYSLNTSDPSKSILITANEKEIKEDKQTSKRFLKHVLELATIPAGKNDD